jgi:hypothetical protein
LVLPFVANFARAFNLNFSASDFGTTPSFSNVTTFSFDIEIDGPLQAGVFSDPVINNIQYSISGTLGTTPSGFPGFGFQLDHIFPSSPPITGAEFYALNPSAVVGGTLQFEISGSANLSDGLQMDELVELPENMAAGIGTGVVFHFNGREEGTGRYHPTFVQLLANGMGTIQNADNMGGINPSTMMVVDVDFGEEYITNLTFDASNLTIVVPEPSRSVLLVVGLAGLFLRRRRFLDR